MLHSEMKLLHLKWRFYEALCGLPQSMKRSLRCMKRHCVPWSEAFSGFIHHFCRRQKWWAVRDSNTWPLPCESSALTNWANRPFQGNAYNINRSHQKSKHVFNKIYRKVPAIFIDEKYQHGLTIGKLRIILQKISLFPIGGVRIFTGNALKLTDTTINI